MISTLVDLLAGFYANNDFSDVEAIARSINSAVPGDLVSLQFLGLVYYRTGRVKDAIRVFNTVIRRRKPAPEEEWEKEGAHLFRHDSAEVMCYRQATRRSPQLAKAWYDLGNVLLELKKFELAIPAFRSSLKAQPSSTEAMLAIGQTALKVNDLAAAQDGFSRLQATQPDNDEAYRGLGLVHRKRREFAAARAYFAWVRQLRQKFASR